MAVNRLLSAWVGLIVCTCGTAWAQSYPSKPVRVVIVFEDRLFKTPFSQNATVSPVHRAVNRTVFGENFGLSVTI